VIRGVLIHPTVIKVVSDSRSSYTPYCNKGCQEHLELTVNFYYSRVYKNPPVTDNLYYSRVYKNSSSSLRCSYTHPTVIKVVSDLRSSYTPYCNKGCQWFTTFITVGCIRTPRFTDNLYYSRVYKNFSSSLTTFITVGCIRTPSRSSYTPYCNKGCQ
jgi:endogenous inhibitor of DNA gyrase (YacG/DUF329 family)